MWAIGGRGDGSGFNDCLIDEVALWDNTLSESEITEIYNSGTGFNATVNSGNYTSSSNLRGYWKFDEGSGTTAADASSNNNTGTINGATWSTDTPITGGTKVNYSSGTGTNILT